MASPCLLLVARRAARTDCRSTSSPSCRRAAGKQQQADLHRHHQGLEISDVRVLVERLLAGENSRLPARCRIEIREKCQSRQADQQLGTDRRGEHPTELDIDGSDPMIVLARNLSIHIVRPATLIDRSALKTMRAANGRAREWTGSHHEDSRVSGEGDPRAYGVPVPQGKSCSRPTRRALPHDRLGGGTVVVKAQIHAGGRGKGGGVKVVKSPTRRSSAAQKMLGMNLVTHQTGPAGQIVQRVLVEQGLQDQARALPRPRARSHHRAARVDGQPRRRRRDREGRRGDARAHLQGVHRIPASASARIQARKLAFALGLEGPQVAQAAKLMTALYDAFVATDASLLEINPLIVTEDGNLLALDAKMNFDDNALYRHPDIKELRDLSRRGSARDRGVEVQPELHQARWHDRLHGQRRRAGDGDDGHHQAGGRRAGELPRRRRRRQRRADPERVQDPDVGQERPRRPDQHLRRHPALRRARRRGDRRGQGSRRAACRSSSAWKAPTSRRASRCSRRAA